MKHFCMEIMIHELRFPTGDETIWAFLRDAYITGNVCFFFFFKLHYIEKIPTFNFS